MDKSEIFSSRLREIRQKHGMTQMAVAKRLGVTRNAVTMWETGSREPRLVELAALSETLEISVDYLLGRTMTRPTHQEGDGMDHDTERKVLRRLLVLDANFRTLLEVLAQHQVLPDEETWRTRFIYHRDAVAQELGMTDDTGEERTDST